MVTPEGYQAGDEAAAPDLMCSLAKASQTEGSAVFWVVVVFFNSMAVI